MAAIAFAGSDERILPIIDFTPFLDPSSSLETKKKTALQIDKACREVGFFYITNKGLPRTLLENMLRNARLFFGNASEEEKQAIRVKKAGDGVGDSARGWKQRSGRKAVHEV